MQQVKMKKMTKIVNSLAGQYKNHSLNSNLLYLSHMKLMANIYQYKMILDKSIYLS